MISSIHHSTKYLTTKPLALRTQEGFRTLRCDDAYGGGEKLLDWLIFEAAGGFGDGRGIVLCPIAGSGWLP
jgi:hypothetical protein